jgi:hypothetical protein
VWHTVQHLAPPASRSGPHWLVSLLSFEKGRERGVVWMGSVAAFNIGAVVASIRVEIVLGARQAPDSANTVQDGSPEVLEGDQDQWHFLTRFR